MTLDGDVTKKGQRPRERGAAAVVQGRFISPSTMPSNRGFTAPAAGLLPNFDCPDFASLLSSNRLLSPHPNWREASMQRMIENLRVSPYAMRYSQFVPRLYNLCRSLGFERDRMMPSRAFCSDESQGYP